MADTDAGGQNHGPFTIHLDINNSHAYRIDGTVGATGKGILIGMLSAFGSAAVVALIFIIIYFFRYTHSGRIFLDRLGRPGEFDDEQAFAREEAQALEEMDDFPRTEYLRAKGLSKPVLYVVRTVFTQLTLSDSFRSGKPTGINANRYFAIAIPRNTRKRCLGMGVRART